MKKYCKFKNDTSDLSQIEKINNLKLNKKNNVKPIEKKNNSLKKIFKKKSKEIPLLSEEKN